MIHHHKLDHPGGRTEILIGAGMLAGRTEGALTEILTELGSWLAVPMSACG